MTQNIQIRCEIYRLGSGISEIELNFWHWLSNTKMEIIPGILPSNFGIT